MNNYVSDDEIKSIRKEYYRNYRLKNKEKMKETQQRFWRKKALENRKKGVNNNEVT